jgi:hypothetical protein
MAEKKKTSDKSALTYDKRILDRNVQKGLVSRADVDAHMKNLPDLATQADNIADKVWGSEPR